MGEKAYGIYPVIKMAVPVGKYLDVVSPEFRLLAASSWIAPEHLAAKQSASIAACFVEEINWEIFLSMVRMHGVQPIVRSMLARYASTFVPDSVDSRLKDWSTAIAVRSLRHAQELLRLAKTFREQGIEILPLKGELLSQQLYGSLGMRSSTDLDILIRPDCLDDVCRGLESEGYLCSLHGSALKPRQKRYIRDNLYHLEFRNDSTGITVELHWHLGSLWSPEQMDLVWKHVESHAIAGDKVSCLNDSVNLLFLCDHGSRHRFCCLKWLSDIARVVALLPEDAWPALLLLADELDLRRTLAHTLLLVERLYQIPLPASVAGFAYADRYGLKMSSKVYDLLQLGSTSDVSHGRRLGGILFSWQVLRLRSSLPLLRTLKPSLIAAEDFHDLPLPDSLFWLYYPLRPFSWLWRYYFK